MAANKANICTYYVCYDKAMSQTGYACELPEVSGSGEQRVLICSSCAKTTRGRFRITKLTQHEAFVCYVGKCKDKYMRQFDSFKYLTDKVDLSSLEAENSFAKWHAKYLA
jgi:hypothetical protein